MPGAWRSWVLVSGERARGTSFSCCCGVFSAAVCLCTAVSGFRPCLLSLVGLRDVVSLKNNTE